MDETLLKSVEFYFKLCKTAFCEKKVKQKFAILMNNKSKLNFQNFKISLAEKFMSWRYL